jgi:hypothetical protein
MYCQWAQMLPGWSFVFIGPLASAQQRTDIMSRSFAFCGQFMPHLYIVMVVI